MSAPSPTSPEPVGLRRARQALERILTRAGAAAPEAAARSGAEAVAPALEALELVREEVAPWEGLIHRGCRIAPAPGSAAHPAPLRLRRLIRGGWELIGATAEVGAGPAAPAPSSAPLLQVRHDLARRLVAAVGPGVPDEPAGTVRASGALRPASAAAGLGPADAVGTTAGRRLLLTGEDAAAWAEATGDDNPVHLIPGAARRAGLEAGEGDVVVHGLLLAALSLSIVPARPGRGGLSLLFPSALAIGRAGAGLVVDEGGSCSSTADGRTALRRRSTIEA
ncbi:MaoC-like protein [Actinomyces sp. Chiba101]|uniref:MaoC/PaaZ C-terminal domain-containing protein n=1 Tax=Actinomyces TaxID=1654 RepID=UPI000974DE22|nr:MULTISPECIES: MaoC/PaaZ C-terminal domain-containing protein [Actinomyces]BAW93854.1 MaoC-like protein [Actinomyces sp. Chiba101]SUU74359.1 MaoC like domain [Actinomyces denticolens]